MRRALYGVPRKGAPQRKTPCAEPQKGGERRGFPQNHEIFFCQLKRKFVNILAASLLRETREENFARSFNFILREAKPRFCLSAPDLP